MKQEDIEGMLGNLDIPDPKNLTHQHELKIPLLSYRKSSRAGLWLLVLPGIAAITIILKYELGLLSPFLNFMYSLLAAIDKNSILTYLIPVIFLGLPMLAMIINVLAFCHFSFSGEKKELLIAVKYRPLNIIIFLFSLAMLLYFFLPDRLSF